MNQLPTRIAGRYRIESELGHGGMARVYRALDERLGRPVALKRLLAANEHAATLQAMFEREYHSLVQLAHPRIVRVFDYGVEDGAPFYTMELLEGADARETMRAQALSVQQICLLLRDAASALALIHSRRMVHRDVGPRNLWCTPDGRAKLIDFGTLVAMGAQTRVAGTAPFVPPEAVYMQPLDARSDMYALGALGYFMLTERNAYPAREFGDLRELWRRRPVPPDAINPELPRALSEVIMSLLSLDPRGRPASAAEVFERLTAIGGLAAEDESHLAQAFLTSPQLVGRAEQSAALRKRLVHALRGRGGTSAVVAPAGLGRSRMLASFVLEAKLMGSTAIMVNASAVGSGPFALATALVERLLETLPLTAATGVELGGLIGHLSPSLHRAFGEPALVTLEPFERTHKLTAALVALFEAVLRAHALVLAVDDVHRADGASLSLLGRLSVLAGEHRFVLLTSCDSAILADAPPALQQLTEPAKQLVLPPLAPEHTKGLLESLFGVVEGIEEAANWLHELSQGSPQTCMQYAQYLVDHRLARYEGGHWKLPRKLREQNLPATLSAMLEARVAELSDDARALALGLALARDESRSAWQPENHVRIEDYPKLLGVTSTARAFSALDELLRAGIVQQRDSYYVLGQRAALDVLLEASSLQMCKRAHARIADVFAQETYSGGMLAMRQLQLAGEHGRAYRALVAYVSDSRAAEAGRYWSGLRVSRNSEVAQQALAFWKEERGPARDGIMLRRQLLLTASVYDWSLARYGVEQLAQLRCDAGLVHWDETDHALPPIQRTLACLKIAQQEFEQKPEAERGLPAVEAIRELAGCVQPLSGAYVNAHDVAAVSALPAVLAPLRPLSPIIDAIGDIAELAVDRVTGREIGSRLALTADRLLNLTDLPAVLRLGGSVIYVHFQAVEDARRGRQRSLVLTDMISTRPAIGDDMFLVVHARWLARAFRGESEQAEALRKRVEVITEDDVWRRKALCFVEAQLYALTGDLPNLNRVTEMIAGLSQTFPGWRPWLGYARGCSHRLRGELDAAERELRAALAQAPAGGHRAYVLVAPALAELLLHKGELDAACCEAERILATVQSMALDVSAAIAAERVRALCESKRGRHEAAQAAIERAFELGKQVEYDGLPLALLYEAQATIANAAEDGERVELALVKLRSLLEHAHAPALIAAYEALRLQSAAAVPELAVDANTSDLALATATFTEVQTHLSAFREGGRRAREALALLLRDTQAKAGCLLLFDARGLFPAASVGLNPDAKVLSTASAYVDRQRSNTETVVGDATSSASQRTETFLTVGETQLAPILLLDRSDGEWMIAGLALLEVHEFPLRHRHGDLVRAISRCLRGAGDTQAVSMDD